MRRLPHVVVLLTCILLIIACSLPANLALPNGTEVQSTHVATAIGEISPVLTETITATPEPPLLDERLNLAYQALFNGNWDAALSQYGAILSDAGDTEMRGLAQLGLVQTHLQAGNFTEAVQTATVFLESFQGHSLTADGYFLRARANQESGEIAEAVLDYDRYLELRSGILDVYVWELSADLLREAGDLDGAVERYKKALEVEDDIGLQLKLGNTYRSLGEMESALNIYRELTPRVSDASTLATLNLLQGLVLQELGDQESAFELYKDSIQSYPEAYDSYVALALLVDADVPVDDYLRGYIDYHAGAYEPALAAFNRQLEVTPAGAGYYYRGLTLEYLGDQEGALADLQIVIEQYPQDPLWMAAVQEKAYLEWAHFDNPAAAIGTLLDAVDRAPQHAEAAGLLFEAGEIAERAGELWWAAELWQRVAVEYPQSTLRFEATFQSGLVLYRLADYGGALQGFEQALNFCTDLEDAAKGRLWAGKAYMAADDEESARAAWAEAARTDPTGYYSERALELISGQQPFQSQGIFDFSTDLIREKTAAEDWLRTRFSISSTYPLDQLDPQMATDMRILRAEEFWRLGLKVAAKQEFEAVRYDISASAEQSYRLMSRLLDLGLYQPAIYTARHILDLAGFDDAGTLDAPVYFNRVRFGAYFGELIFPEALANDLDGLFVLSVARQESLFEGFITSYAAARMG